MERRYTLDNGEVLTIRKALPEDARDIVNYVNRVAGETDNMTFGRDEFGISVQQEREILEDSKNSNNSLFLLGIVNHEIISTLIFFGGKRPRIAHSGEFGISVSKICWGLGIGRRMIHHMIEWAKKTDTIRVIYLRVRTDNERAIKLYEKMGFESNGLFRREFLVKEKFYDSLIMSLFIES